MTKPAPKVRRTPEQNARFHAMLSEWAQRSGQDAARLKRRVKRHMGACVKLPFNNDDYKQAFATIAQAFKAMGHDDVLRLLPTEGAAIVYQSSANWDKATMARAISTVDLLAGEEGYTLGPADNRGDV